MSDVSLRELRNHGGEVLDRVSAGERVVITRAGRRVAELRPLRPQDLRANVLVERWRHLPSVDAEQLRADVDAVVEQSL